MSVSFSINTQASEQKPLLGEWGQWFTSLSTRSSPENNIPAGVNVIDTIIPDDMMGEIFNITHKRGNDLQTYRTITRVCHRWHTLVRNSIHEWDICRVFQNSPFLPTTLMAVILADSPIPNCSNVTKLSFSLSGHTQKNVSSYLPPQDVMRRLSNPADRLLNNNYKVLSQDWWALHWHNDLKENMKQIQTTAQQSHNNEIGTFRAFAGYAYNCINGAMDLKLLSALQGDAQEIQNNLEWTTIIRNFLSTFSGLQTLILTVNHSVNLSILSGLPHLAELHIGPSYWKKPTFYTCSWPQKPQLGIKKLKLKNKFWPEDGNFFTFFPNLTSLHLALTPPVNEDEKGKIAGLALDLCALHSPNIEILSLKYRTSKEIDIVSPIAKWPGLKKLSFKNIMVESSELETILQSPSLTCVELNYTARFKKMLDLNAANPAMGATGGNVCRSYTDEELIILRERYPNISIITKETGATEEDDF